MVEYAPAEVDAFIAFADAVEEEFEGVMVDGVEVRCSSLLLPPRSRHLGGSRPAHSTWEAHPPLFTWDAAQTAVVICWGPAAAAEGGKHQPGASWCRRNTARAPLFLEVAECPAGGPVTGSRWHRCCSFHLRSAHPISACVCRWRVGRAPLTSGWRMDRPSTSRQQKGRLQEGACPPILTCLTGCGRRGCRQQPETQQHEWPFII